jgi:hypothetical protein
MRKHPAHTSSEKESDVTPQDQSYTIIPLTKGVQSIIDTEDIHKLDGLSWHAGWVESSGCYRAEAGTVIDGKKVIVRMHRVILGLKHGDKRVVDHINGDQLDNRKKNLRICNRSNNGMNRGKNENNTSGYKGVSLDRFRNKWVAQLMVNGKHIFIGRFNTKEEAYEAYCEAAYRINGEFARIS